MNDLCSILPDLKILKVREVLKKFHQWFWNMNFYQVECCYSYF